MTTKPKKAIRGLKGKAIKGSSFPTMAGISRPKKKFFIGMLGHNDGSVHLIAVDKDMKPIFKRNLRALRKKLDPELKK